MLATVSLCLVTGILGGLEVYAGQLIWPNFRTYPDIDTAFVAVAGRAAGPWMFNLMNFTLLMATVGSSIGAQLGSVRLLYAMGRDNVIPKGFFGQLEPKRNTPRNNILLTGSLMLVGALLLTYQFGAELLNYGAFIAFMESISHRQSECLSIQKGRAYSAGFSERYCRLLASWFVSAYGGDFVRWPRLPAQCGLRSDSFTVQSEPTGSATGWNW